VNLFVVRHVAVAFLDADIDLAYRKGVALHDFMILFGRVGLMPGHLRAIATYMRLTYCLPIVLYVLVGCGANSNGPEESGEVAGQSIEPLADLLRTARRIPNSSKWFEIIELPDDVYALWEAGHAEKVNSFLITGTQKDVLYDPRHGHLKHRTDGY
jgi:hypothetical protein